MGGNSAEETRNRKRKQSNRESARRSRIRKQKHLDELTAQIALLRTDNCRMVATCQATTQQLLCVEADNSVLRAQIDELTNRLHSLNGILSYISSTTATADGGGAVVGGSRWSNLGYVTQQPIMASADYHTQ